MMDMMTRFWFELAPVILAMASALLCSVRASVERGRLRVFFTLATIASVLLILAQTSWWSVIIFQLKEVTPYIDDDAANMVWTLFNITVTIAFIVSAFERERICKALRK